jgi:hypothetical protein
LFTSDGHIALHISLRFHHPASPFVVLNSCLNGIWRQEQRAGARGTLNIGVEFTAKIICQPQFYEVNNCDNSSYLLQIFINNIHIADFPHHVNVNSVSTVEITGELILHDVAFIAPSNSMPLPGVPKRS